MDNLVFWVWVITRLDSLNGLMAFLTFAAGVATFVLFFISFMNMADVDSPSSEEEKNDKFTKYYRLVATPRKIGIWMAVVCVILSLINVALPDKKSALYIAGTYLAVKVVSSDSAQKMGASTFGVVEKFLNKQMLQLDMEIQELKDAKKSDDTGKEAPKESTPKESKPSEDDLVDELSPILREAAVASVKKAAEKAVGE